MQYAHDCLKLCFDFIIAQNTDGELLISIGSFHYYIQFFNLCRKSTIEMVIKNIK